MFLQCLRKVHLCVIMLISYPKGGGRMRLKKSYIVKMYKTAKVVKTVLTIVKTLRDLLA